MQREKKLPTRINSPDSVNSTEAVCVQRFTSHLTSMWDQILFMTLCSTQPGHPETVPLDPVGCSGLLRFHRTGTAPLWFITHKHFNTHDWPNTISKAGCMWAASGREMSSERSLRPFRGRLLSHSINQLGSTVTNKVQLQLDGSLLCLHFLHVAH